VLLRRGPLPVCSAESGHDVVGPTRRRDPPLPEHGPKQLRGPTSFVPRRSFCRRRSPMRASRPPLWSAPNCRHKPILVLSQYVEETVCDGSYWPTTVQGVGYLLKERVGGCRRLRPDACQRVAAGGTVLDPEVVAQLLARGRARGRSTTSRPRERRGAGSDWPRVVSNSGIARHLVVSDGAVEKHISSIFSKLGLASSDTPKHRRVAGPS